MNWFQGWRSGNYIIDKIITSPALRWTWSGPSDVEFSGALREYRPTDVETVHEMRAGRYLLASKLVDTSGVSPFATHHEHELWHNELHGFSWLRHFSEAHNAQDREFARTLVLDWISRNSDFDTSTWGLALSAQRVMNWLRHFALLCEGASREQIKTISRSISMQVQASKLRARYSTEHFEELMAAMLPVAVALCDGSDLSQTNQSTKKLCKLLEWQLDEDGFYQNRNPKTQLVLLEELVSLRLTLSQLSSDLVHNLGLLIDKMHLALDSVTLTTGEPVYFNGCGQLPTELVFAIQTQGKHRRSSNTSISGYGVIELGQSMLVLDEGRVPLAPFATNAHASALAVEFSSGRDLIFGSCGPAPGEFKESRDLFRHGSAHSGPTINDSSAARFSYNSVLLSHGDKPFMQVGTKEPEIIARTGAYRSRFGVEIERRVTLLSDGNTLVGQDLLIVPGERRKFSGTLTQRFHLAPGTKTQRTSSEQMIAIHLQSGSVWSFLWEGAAAHVEESMRQSAHIGFYRTEQIVLESEVGRDIEISWIFTRQ